MPEHAEHSPALPDASAGHERSDAQIGPLLSAAAVLVAVAVAVHIIIWAVMVLFEHSARRGDPPVSPVAAPQIPVAPMLQPTMQFSPALPAEDMHAMRRRTQKHLSTYGWIDREKGIVHMPIDVAMQKLLEQSQASIQESQE